MDTIFIAIKNFTLGCVLAILIPMTVDVCVNIVHPLSPYKFDYPASATKDVQEKARDEYDAVYQRLKDEHAFYYFYIAAPVGIIALVIGALIPIAFLKMGFIWSGIFCLCIAYFNYWAMLHAACKLISLLLAIFCIIFFAHRNKIKT